MIKLLLQQPLFPSLLAGILLAVAFVQHQDFLVDRKLLNYTTLLLLELLFLPTVLFTVWQRTLQKKTS